MPGAVKTGPNSVPQYLKPVFYANGKEQIKQKLAA